MTPQPNGQAALGSDATRAYLAGLRDEVEALIARMPSETQEQYRASSKPHAALREFAQMDKALATYESMVMGTLARLPNHWQQYRDLLELGPQVQEARRVGRAALDRRLNV